MRVAFSLASVQKNLSRIKKSPKILRHQGRFVFGKFISGDPFSKLTVSHIEWIDHSRHRDSPSSVAESFRITPDAYSGNIA
jgi:hypothetical protein